MDPCPFTRLTVSNLALKIIPSSSSKSSSHHSTIHPTSSLCFCKIKLKKSPPQSAPVPINQSEPEAQNSKAAATFHLSKDDVDKLVRKFMFAGKLRLKIAVRVGSRGGGCVIGSGKLLGKITVPLDMEAALSRPVLFHNGWIEVGKDGSGSSVQLHLTVMAEPDPRFVFQFDGEPECSPQVFQIQGRIRQPVFTCKFNCSSTIGDRTNRSRSLNMQRRSSVKKRLFKSFSSLREGNGKERKGWSITVHDLSGSPVAVASMVTPFVASPNSDRVGRSNPGSWVILRPGDGTLKPWARLEAWRQHSTSDSLGLRFELVTESPDPYGSSGIVLAESNISTANGGKFMIDLGSVGTISPRSSADFGAGYNGFVMSATVEGEGKCSKPVVEVSAHHVGYLEDAAAFVAVAAAVDLSMDACRLFSHKLRKELTSQRQMFG